MRKRLFLLAIISCAVISCAGITYAAISYAGTLAPTQAAARVRSGGPLNFSVTDRRRVITRDMGGGLLLRAVKERSANAEHFGWRVEVVRRPYRETSRNLLYHSRRTLGAHPSQVYAWHVASGQFPNERELDVSGRPVAVRLELINPEVVGEGPESRFVSGELRITWGPKRNFSRERR